MDITKLGGGIADREAFDFFRDLYEKQLKIYKDCESAFAYCVVHFFSVYGYKPYENLEEYLSELFQKLNGYTIFEK